MTEDVRPKTDPTGRPWNAPKVSVEQIANALRDARGNKSAAARNLTQTSGVEVSRRYLAGKIDSNPALLELVEDLRESVIDNAETNIFDAIAGGRLEESKFVLTTIGKDRGYVKTVVTEEVSTEELARRMALARKRARENQGDVDGPSPPGGSAGDSSAPSTPEGGDAAGMASPPKVNRGEFAK